MNEVKIRLHKKQNLNKIFYFFASLADYKEQKQCDLYSQHSSLMDLTPLGI